MQVELPPLSEYSFELPQILDSTMLSAFNKCPRFFFNAYMQHLRGATSELPLVFGGTFATGLEVYRIARYVAGESHELAWAEAAEAMITKWGDHPSQFTDRYGKPDKRSLDRCIYAIKQYFEHWPVETDPLQPHRTDHDGKVSFEFSFSLPLEKSLFPRHPSGEPFVLVGRIDTLGTYENYPVFSDEKSTTRGGATWAEQWVTRFQFMTYTYALKELGYKARRAVVRGIVIRAEETDFLETPPILFQDYVIDKWEKELANTLWRMREMAEQSTLRREPAFNRNFGDPCYAWFRRCGYWDACAAKPQNELAYLKMISRNKWDPLRISGED